MEQAGQIAAGAERRARNAFVYQSEVFFDDLDAMAMLHNARYAIHLERAIAALYGSSGKHWLPDPAENPDQFHVVREATVEYLSPFRGVGPMMVDLWVVRLGSTSCQYGFQCRNGDGSVTYASGKRLIIKLDPESLKPTPWSDEFLQLHRPLVAAPVIASGAGAPGGTDRVVPFNRAVNSTLEVRVDGSAPGEG